MRQNSGLLNFYVRFEKKGFIDQGDLKIEISFSNPVYLHNVKKIIQYKS